MKKLTTSNNINSSLTGDIGKKPNLENPVYSNNPSSILTGSIDNIPAIIESFRYSNRASLVSKGNKK